MLVSIERPVTTTLRPEATAASQICWTRWTWLLNDAAMTRCSAFWMMSRRAGPTEASDSVTPGVSALVESDMSRSTPMRPNFVSAP